MCAGPILEHPACTACVTARPYMLRDPSPRAMPRDSLLSANQIIRLSSSRHEYLLASVQSPTRIALSYQFRLATHSLRRINRRKVLVSPRGPFSLASKITMRGNSGVLGKKRAQDREFRHSKKKVRPLYPSPKDVHPPFDGRATTQVKTCHGGPTYLLLEPTTKD